MSGRPGGVLFPPAFELSWPVPPDGFPCPVVSKIGLACARLPNARMVAARKTPRKIGRIMPSPFRGPPTIDIRGACSKHQTCRPGHRHPQEIECVSRKHEKALPGSHQSVNLCSSRKWVSTERYTSGAGSRIGTTPVNLGRDFASYCMYRLSAFLETWSDFTFFLRRRAREHRAFSAAGVGFA